VNEITEGDSANGVMQNAPPFLHRRWISAKKMALAKRSKANGVG
jgi:hypothetical protein